MSSKDDLVSHIPPVNPLTSSYKEQVNKMRRIMENKITANKMALVRSRLANHDQAKSKSTSHRKANKVSGESKLDISNRIKNLKSVFINKEGEKSSLLDGDNSKRISTESEKCVISNGMLSLHLENKNEVIKPKPPPLVCLKF